MSFLRSSFLPLGAVVWPVITAGFRSFDRHLNRQTKRVLCPEMGVRTLLVSNVTWGLKANSVPDGGGVWMPYEEPETPLRCAVVDRARRPAIRHRVSVRG